MNNEAYRCAVIGKPIAHSKSPEIHAEFARKAGINLTYDKIEAQDEEDFKRIVNNFFTSGGRGLNITVPYKELAYKIADKSSPYAEMAKAANTLSFDGKNIIADNTDGRGLVHALKHDCNFSLQNKKALLIGAGGAARGVVLPLLEEKISKIDVYNRSPEKAQNLVSELNIPNLYAIEQVTEYYDLIINATATGLSSNLASAKEFFANNFPPSTLNENSLAYEMMYGKQTPFMDWAKNANCQRIFDGYSMLIAQARISFDIWFA